MILCVFVVNCPPTFIVSPNSPHFLNSAGNATDKVFQISPRLVGKNASENCVDTAAAADVNLDPPSLSNQFAQLHALR